MTKLSYSELFQLDMYEKKKEYNFGFYGFVFYRKLTIVMG